jgi:hypothetical protein
MAQNINTIIVTDCGKEFELNHLVAIHNGTLYSNANYTFTIYKTPTQEYIQKKSFFNPAINHTSVNFEMMPESTFQHISTTLEKR